MVMALNPKTGAVTELFHGGSLTAMRTGAAAGLATRLLANPSADVLTVIGAGGMAFDQIAAVCAVRNIRRVVISSRTRERAETLAGRVRSELGVSSVDVIDDANTAVAEAQIVCTVTTSAEPVFSADAIQPGTHINASGAYLPHMTEIPLELIAQSGFYVDRLSSALHESGEVVQGIARGVFTAEHIRGELGGIVSGLTPARQSAEEVTVFKSAGMAVQDAAMVAAYLRLVAGE
jgi:ornithine cyclodeaminase